MKLNISNIQHFSVGDGAGIRTTVFFKGCNLKCPWCHNPENLYPEPVVLKYKNSNKPEVCGRLVTVNEILPELLEDIDFFEESGGGVTLSGGEVMLQANSVKELVKALKESQVSVLIDTAGCVPYKAFEKLNKLVDGYLFDFKTADEKKYKEIGGNLKLITENIKRLLSENINVQIRIPLIPDFNTDEESVLEICNHLKNIGINKVDLLPFHRLGSAKYEAMNLTYSYKECEPISKDRLKEIKNIYSDYFEIKTEN